MRKHMRHFMRPAHIAHAVINTRVNLKRLVNLIDEIEWTGHNVDVKATAYEGLLEKSSSEDKI